ncbi:MAG: response regulator [Gloeotrichia echinulata CP02]|jgi:DNA-binding response OmpR family regulator|nr:response regulator [Gloeotrichia echinulata DEX184]
MSHFLIVEDEDFIRREWKRLLNKENHTYIEAADVDQGIKAIEQSEREGEPFDLILLDHKLGDETGVDLLEYLDFDYCQHRIVVITGNGSVSLAKEYAKVGAIGHLIKPVSEVQFQITITSVLERRAIYVDEKENWQSAYKLLEDIGLLDSIERLKADSAKVAEEYEHLKLIYEQLIADLEKAGGRESEIAQAYLKATDTLNSSPGGIDSILPFLEEFMITASFWSDIENVFSFDRLHFFILQSYLKRIRENPYYYRIKHLIGGATGHYEYRIGKSYRLYFRREGDVIILERFGHKNIQSKIINYLSSNLEGFMESCVVTRKS